MGVRGAPRNEPRAGSRLDPETAEYFRRALETLEEGLSPEELELFAPNVLAEAVAALPGVALDPWGSRVLQTLAPRTPLGTLGQLLPPLVLGGLGGPAGHPLGARVLEAALGRALKALHEEEEEEGAVEGAVGQLAEAVRGDLVGFARHPAGSFVLRALLRVLGGVPGPGAPQLPPKDEEAWPNDEGVGSGKGAGLPPSFPPLLDQLAQALEEHLPCLLIGAVAALQAPVAASLCLQVALEVLHCARPPTCARLCAAIFDRHGDCGLVQGLQDPERSRLLEAAMTVSEPERLRRLFRQHLRGRLRGLAGDRVGNHGLQRLLGSAPGDLVEEALSELGPFLSESLARGHPGVLTALVGACRRHPQLQPKAVRWLLQAFGCWEPRERRRSCVGALAELRPRGDQDEEAGPEPALGAVTLPGSLLLQHLLHFAVPEPVLGALSALPPPALATLARSPPGSHVWDAILGSPAVPSRARRRLLRKLRGHFVSLACHRNGSRVLEAVWASSSSSARAAIAEELAPQLEALRRDPHGRGVARSLDLDLFLRRRHLWLQRLRAAPKPRPCLAAILED